MIREIIDLNVYQEAALRTAKIKESEDVLLNNAALGLAGEAGEVADLVKKIQHQGHPLDDDTAKKLANELGDILWYVSLASYALSIPMTEIAAMNIDKLQARYPEGFSVERSVNRAE